MSLGIMNTPAEERFDRITRMAARVLNTPFALVSLVADDRQWFKSAHGIAASSSPRDVSFCGHTIGSDGPMIVESMLDDPRFFDNPLVLDGPRIRAYAGQSISVGEARHRVGTLCVLDVEPRQFSAEDVSSLRDLAAIVEDEIARGVLSDMQDELERRALVDPLTRLWNRGAIMDLLEKELARARRGTPISVGMIDADNFKRVNDTYGHPVGDEVLRELALRIRASIRECDEAGRYGGEEFLVLLSNCDERYAHVAGERIRAAIAARPFTTAAGAIEMTVSVGLTTYGPEPTPCDALVAACDRALYVAKGNGRNRVATG
jgi:diguanylate cyclase (GGDEF)-like protein